MPLAPEHLACSSCNARIPAEDWNREHAFCVACRAPLHVLVFPAFFSLPAAASNGTAVLEAGEASCFYHPRKQAVVPCDRCGRFLCSLCQVEFLGERCPRCIQASSEKGQLAQLDPSRKLYDNLALMLAVFRYCWSGPPLLRPVNVVSVCSLLSSTLQHRAAHQGSFLYRHRACGTPDCRLGLVGAVPHLSPMSTGSQYARLPGRSGFFVSHSVWLSADHVLSVRRNPFSESYRRYYFADIQAIVLTELPNLVAPYGYTVAVLLLVTAAALFYTGHPAWGLFARLLRWWPS